ncbi:MAG: hypothetical protein VX640_08035 [Pseudomonadota bacterium]|nr:hypothetical protein [Pseudomonadota bacterium]
MVWYVALMQTSSYLSAAVYYRDHPVPGKNYAQTAVAACIKAAIVTYSTIHLKGYAAENLIGNNQRITKKYWPKVIAQTFQPDERSIYSALENRILSLRGNRIAHVNGSELRPIASLDSIGGMQTAFDWPWEDTLFWAEALEKLLKTVIDIWSSIEVPKSEWAPSSVTVEYP